MADKNPELTQPALDGVTVRKLQEYKANYMLQEGGFNKKQIATTNQVRRRVLERKPEYSEHAAKEVSVTQDEEAKLKQIMSNSLTKKDKAALRHFKRTYAAKSALEQMGYSPEEARATQHRLRKDGFSEEAIFQKAKDELEARKQLEREKPIRPDLVFKEVT